MSIMIRLLCILTLATATAPAVLAQTDELSLEATILEDMKEVERGLRDLNMDAATTERLVQQAKETLLKSYCLQSRLEK